MINREAAKRFLGLITDPSHRWLSGPVAVAVLLVLVVLVKSCQGIVYLHTNECKIYRTGYSMEEARMLAAALDDGQVERLVARGEPDSVARRLPSQRYFIGSNMDRYLDYHKAHKAITAAADVVAIVNTNQDLDQTTMAVKSDTTMGDLILVNRYHYLEKGYKRNDLEKIRTTCAYPGNYAARAVVDAFYKMQEDCKRQTGAQLMANTSYRDYSYQAQVFKIHDKSTVASPGYSEHQTGLGLDITSIEHPEKWAFGKSAEGQWTQQHCHKYGFIVRYPEGKEHITGYGYEPWHLRYVGVDAACRIHEEGITFDEYYAFYIEHLQEQRPQ